MSRATQSPPATGPALAELVAAALEPLFLRLRRPLVRSTMRRIAARVGAAAPAGSGWQLTDERRWREVQVCLLWLDEIRLAQAALRRDLDELDAQLAQSGTAAERDFLLRRFVAGHAGQVATLRPDGAATRRGFDGAALHERLRLGWAQDDHRIEILLTAIGVALAAAVTEQAAAAPPDWNGLASRLAGSEGCPLLARVADSAWYWRHRVAAIRGLARVAAAVPPERWALVYPAASHAVLFRLAYRSEDPVWVQIAAIAGLRACDADQWLTVCAQRLAEGALRKDDDLFVRHAIVRSLPTAPDQARALKILAGCLLPADIADRVRQGALAGLCQMDLAQALPFIQRSLGLLRGAEADPTAPVRALAVATLLDELPRRRATGRTTTHNLLHQVLLYERHPLVLRVLLERLPERLVFDDAAPPASDGRPPIWCEALLQAIDELGIDGTVPLATRRLAQECRDALICRCLPRWRHWLELLVGRLRQRPEGARLRLQLPAEAPDWPQLARILVEATRDDLGISLRRRGRRLLLQRGDRFVPRLWRLCYEWRHPGPDKRQGFFHSLGRQAVGPDRFPPLLLGEESPTKVPGEPVFCADEGQWRRYLPLVDDLWDCTAGGRQPVTIRLHSAQGVLALTGPSGWWAKQRLRGRLLRSAGELHRLRGLALADLADVQEPHPYPERLRQLGFTLRLQPQGWLDHRAVWHPLVDPTLQRYFGMPVISCPAGATEVASGGAGIAVLAQSLDQWAASAAGDMDQVATERAVQTATAARRDRAGAPTVDAGIREALVALGQAPEAEVLDAHDTQELLSIASERLDRGASDYQRAADEAIASGAHDTQSYVADELRREPGLSPVTDRRSTEAVAEAASERLRRARRSGGFAALEPLEGTTPTAGERSAGPDRQDELATEALAGPASTGSTRPGSVGPGALDPAGALDPVSSRRQQRRQRLVEERSERQTMEHHRSVTQQLRRLGQLSDDASAGLADDDSSPAHELPPTDWIRRQVDDAAALSDSGLHDAIDPADDTDDADEPEEP